MLPAQRVAQNRAEDDLAGWRKDQRCVLPLRGTAQRDHVSGLGGGRVPDLVDWDGTWFADAGEGKNRSRHQLRQPMETTTHDPINHTQPSPRTVVGQPTDGPRLYWNPDYGWTDADRKHGPVASGPKAEHMAARSAL